MKMKNNLKIHGLLMTPCAESEEHFERIWQSTKHSVNYGFINSYNEHIGAMSIIANNAKLFILKNYKSINDW